MPDRCECGHARAAHMLNAEECFRCAVPVRVGQVQPRCRAYRAERDRQPERDVIHVGEPARGAFTGTGIPGVLRKSTIVKNLRNQEGGDRAADAIESAYEATGTLCPTHGRLDDPIVGLLGDSVAFICPQCSSPEMLAAWEAEGKQQEEA